MKRKLLRIVSFFAILIAYFFLVDHLATNVKPSILKDFILRWEAKATATTFFLLTFFTFLKRDEIVSVFRKVKKTTWMMVLSILVISFLIREFLPPKTHRLFFDEDIYMEMGREILLNGASCHCAFGNSTTCFNCELMKWPAAHPFFIAISYMVGGISENSATQLSIILSTLTSFFIFLASYVAFGKEKPAILSMLIFSLLPLQILWSTTAAAEITFSFLLAVAIFFTILSITHSSFSFEVLALFSVSLASQAKAEAIVIFPLYCLTLLLFKRRILSDKKFLGTLLLSLLLCFPNFLHIIYASKVDTWGAPGEKMSLKYLKRNLKDNLSFYLETYRNSPGIYIGKQLYHPVIFTIFALIGLLYSIGKYTKIGITMFLWFSVFLVIYSSFYAGSVLYGVDVRYILPQYPIFCLFSGLGAYFVGKKLRKIGMIMILLLISFSFLSYLESIRMPAEFIEEASDARTYRNFAVKFAKEFEGNCYFLSHVTSIYSVMEKPHIQIWYVYRPEFEEVLKNNCVVFDEGYWCAIKVKESRSCIEANKYDLKLLARLEDERHGKIYSFYEIRKR